MDINFYIIALTQDKTVYPVTQKKPVFPVTQGKPVFPVAQKKPLTQGKPVFPIKLFKDFLDVRITVGKGIFKEINSLRLSLARMVARASNAFLKKYHDIGMAKAIVYSCRNDLHYSIDSCENFSDLVYLIGKQCTLTDIVVLQFFAEELEYTEAIDHIEEYEKKLEDSCVSISTSLDLKEKLNAESDAATFVLPLQPEDQTLKDITDVLSKVSDKQVRIEFN